MTSIRFSEKFLLRATPTPDEMHQHKSVLSMIDDWLSTFSYNQIIDDIENNPETPLFDHTILFNAPNILLDRSNWWRPTLKDRASLRVNELIKEGEIKKASDVVATYCGETDEGFEITIQGKRLEDSDVICTDWEDNMGLLPSVNTLDGYKHIHAVIGGIKGIKFLLLLNFISESTKHPGEVGLAIQSIDGRNLLEKMRGYSPSPRVLN